MPTNFSTTSPLSSETHMASKISPLQRLFRYVPLQEKRRIWYASVLSILNKVADLAPPALIGMAVDIVVNKQNSFLSTIGITDSFWQLVWLAIGTVVIWGLESIFEYAFQWEWRTLAQDIQHRLRTDAHRHVQRLDMTWFRDNKSGRLMSIVNDDINQLERFLDSGTNDIIQVGTTVVCVTAAFFWFSPTIALMAMMPIPIILWGSFLFQAKIAPRYALVREKSSLINSYLANNIIGIETVKAFTAEEREVSIVEKLSIEYKKSNEAAIKLSSAFSPLIRMAVVLGFVTTLIYGGQLVLDGAMEVGVYSVLVFLTQRLLWPLTRLGATFDVYQRAMASSNRVFDLLDRQSETVDGQVELPKIDGEIRLDRVSFAYPNRETVLEDFSLHVPAGKTVAIVGPTGSGKSTIVRLLLRFYDVTEGSITIDGVSIYDMKLAQLRGSIGLVSQSVYLFDGTVWDNIVYGRPDAREEEVIAAAIKAEIHDFIQSLPQGYHTPIGERGVKLSGGQSQRISIARAIIIHPAILILDEATSAVDNETEAAIQRSLETVSKDRSTIVIAHRLSTIRNADHIVVMDHGKIVAQGSHEQLLQDQGLYHRLWNVQTGQR